jgi:hypothetical protein
VAGVRPRSPYAVVLLSQIHEPEIERERAYHRRRLFRRELGKRRLQGERGSAALALRPAPSLDGEFADFFFEGEELLSLEIDEHLAEQPAEPPNIAAQGPIDFATGGGWTTKR